MSDASTEDPQTGAGDGGGAAGDGGGGGAAQPGISNPGGGGQAVQPGPGGNANDPGGSGQPGTGDPSPGGQPPPGGLEPQHGDGDPQHGGQEGVVPNEPGLPGQGGLPGQRGEAVDPGAHQARHGDGGDDDPDIEYVQIPHPHHGGDQHLHAGPHPGGSGGDGMAVSIDPGSVHATAQRMRSASSELRQHAARVAPHAVLAPFPPEARAALEHRLSHLLTTLHQLVEELEHEAADLEQRAGHAEAENVQDSSGAAPAGWSGGGSDQTTRDVAAAALGGGIAAAVGGIAGRRKHSDEAAVDPQSTRPSRRPS
jgi:hypothetical protein